MAVCHFYLNIMKISCEDIEDNYFTHCSAKKDQSLRGVQTESFAIFQK